MSPRPNANRRLRTATALALAILMALPAFAQQKKAPPRRPAPKAAAPAPAEAPGAVSEEQAVVDLERRILDFIRDKQSKELEPWIGDDFQYIDVDGKVEDREQFLKRVAATPGTIEWLSAENMRVRILGPLAIVTGVQQARLSNAPADVIPTAATPPPQTASTAFTDVFRRRGSAWELIMVYAVELPAKTEPAAAPAPAAQPPATAKPPTK